jgi:hypothetical protein
MGWIDDFIAFAVAGFFCVIIAHFVFGVQISDTGSFKAIFLLSVFGSLILACLMSKVELIRSAVLTIFWFLVGAGIVYFAWPLIVGGKNTITQFSAGSDPAIAESSVITIPPTTKLPQATYIPQETFLPRTTALPQTTPKPIEYFTRSYHWTYGGISSTYTISIPEPLYDYYRGQPHNRNYPKYAISPSDRKVLDRIISTFKENFDSDTEAACNVVAFVQSLPYFKDNVSTGYDEYPRYPIETLVDNGGDCEDTAILTAALLKEMNYDVVLISPPGHMAVGITCKKCSGTYYTYNDKKYYYLETTGNNWKVGQIPSKYKGEKVKVYPI